MAQINGNGKEKPKVSLGAEWRRRRAQEHLTRLPSGNLAKLRTVDLYGLMEQGDVPDVLTTLAASVLFEGADKVISLDEPAKGKADRGDILERARQRVDLINLVCKAAFVEPRIVDDPQADDELAIDDVHMEDRAFVFWLALRPAEELSRFRYESPPDVEAVQQRDDAPSEAEPATAQSNPA
jgi:hypothetical protein